MSLDPSDFGWTLGVHGYYEPVPALDAVAPEELLHFTSYSGSEVGVAVFTLRSGFSEKQMLAINSES